MRVPNTNWKIRKGPDWWDECAEDYFKGKRVLVISLPGAFTPIWSSEHLPGLEELHGQFKDKGIDEIYCISVNDTYVMNAWFADWKIKNVKPIADGNGHFTRRLGMLINKTDKGFGMRSWRYAAVVNDLKVEQWFEEPGINDNGSDDDPYGQSSPSNVLNNL